MSVTVPAPPEVPAKEKSATRDVKPIINAAANPFKHESPVAEIEKKDKAEILINIKSIKKEKLDPVQPKPKKVVTKKEASSSDSSSSSSSSDSSSSSEEEIPPMPKPLKTTKTKKEKSKTEDDVVCLGKQSNIENLIDDNDGECLVCKSENHPSEKCTKKCIKCSHSSYSTQIVCNTCGETYPPKTNAIPAAPNPFLMFMQFMQFCMGQYFDVNKEMSQPIPGPAPVQGNSQEVEVTRQDIVDSAKRHRKKSKSEAKRRKKRKIEQSSDSDSETDSDSSSKATVSTKKRKKITTVQPSTPSSTKTMAQQMMQNMPGTMPNMQSYPFGGGFNNTGFNPMMAFSQMMGMPSGSPGAMNFQQKN